MGMAMGMEWEWEWRWECNGNGNGMAMGMGMIMGMGMVWGRKGMVMGPNEPSTTPTDHTHTQHAPPHSTLNHLRLLVDAGCQPLDAR